MTRAPEVKMALLTNLIVLVVVPAAIFARGMPAPGGIATAFMATGAVAFTFFGLLQLMFNQFGFDRDGFRALVLLPVGRRFTLIAKNLSLVPVVFGLGVALLAVLKVVVSMPWLVFLAGCFQLVATFLLLSIAGNLLSIVVPYRIGAGSLKPTKATGKTTLLIFLSHLLFPVAMVPIFTPPTIGWLAGSLGGWPATLVNALLSVLLAALGAFFYWLSLRSLGDLLQRREKEILQVVSQEVE
jgi:MFS family permease